MSEDQSLRELVNARLTAAAEEIFTLFERTISGYKDELARSKEENQRKQQLLDSILFPTIKLVRVDTHFPPGPDESEEHHIKQEEEQPFTESTVICIKREESPSPLQQRQKEHQEQTQREDFSSECDVKCENSPDNDKDCLNPLTVSQCSEFEDNGDHYLENQIRKNKSVPETCVFGNSGVMSGTDGGAECNNPQSVKICNDNEGQKSEEHEQPIFKRNNNNLPSQMENHTQERPFSCSICMKTFSTIFDFNDHEKEHNEKPYNSVICSQLFTQNNNLKLQNKMHTSEKPFICTVCEKTFRCRIHLRTHMRTHTGEKPFSCAFCSKTFSQKNDLHRHTRIHTGEKPFSCTICNKMFSQKNDLGRHIRIHTGEKPFSCTVCAKEFTRKASLHRHTRKHTGEKPFSCTVCQKTFTMKVDLKRHSKSHTSDKPQS